MVWFFACQSLFIETLWNLQDSMEFFVEKPLLTSTLLIRELTLQWVCISLCLENSWKQIGWCEQTFVASDLRLGPHASFPFWILTAPRAMEIELQFQWPEKNVKTWLAAFVVPWVPAYSEAQADFVRVLHNNYSMGVCYCWCSSNYHAASNCTKQNWDKLVTKLNN
jgi:hypothetical protein